MVNHRHEHGGDNAWKRRRYPVSSAAWLDAQHLYMDIAQQAGQRTVPHVVAVLAVMATATAATGRTRPLPTPRRGAAGAAEAAAAGRAAV